MVFRRYWLKFLKEYVFLVSIFILFYFKLRCKGCVFVYDIKFK